MEEQRCTPRPLARMLHMACFTAVGHNVRLRRERLRSASRAADNLDHKSFCKLLVGASGTRHGSSSGCMAGAVVGRLTTLHANGDCTGSQATKIGGPARHVCTTNSVCPSCVSCDNICSAYDKRLIPQHTLELKSGIVRLCLMQAGAAAAPALS